MAQTDHTFFADKVQLRLRHLPDGDLRVLDCFAGEGFIWRAIREATGREIEVLPLDIRDGFGFHLPGDNRRYLSTIDLSRFNVIDVDAYGVPYDQLKMIFERGYQGTVFVTFARVWAGIMKQGLLRDVGFTLKQIRECPTLFGKDGWAYFKEWLALNGVRRIWHRSESRKHYLAFDTGLD